MCVKGGDVVQAVRAGLCPESKLMVVLPTDIEQESILPQQAPDPAVWGPPLWQSIFTANPPPTGREPWLSNLLSPMPCGDCKQHTAAYIAANPINWDHWFEYWWLFKCRLNERLRRTSIGLDKARELYKMP